MTEIQKTGDLKINFSAAEIGKLKEASLGWNHVALKIHSWLDDICGPRRKVFTLPDGEKVLFEVRSADGSLMGAMQSIIYEPNSPAIGTGNFSHAHPVEFKVEMLDGVV